MKIIGIVIRRKYNRTNKKLFRKEIKNLHRRIKKKDEIYTDYTIEKDEDKTSYHSHLLIKYNDEKNLFDNLSRFNGGTVFTTHFEREYPIKKQIGKWGTIQVHEVPDEDWFRSNYMNKYNITELLR